MSDENLLIGNEAWQKPLGLSKQVLDRSSTLLSEQYLCRMINQYADLVARQLRDFRQSAAVRHVLENPGSMKKQYDMLFSACRARYLQETFMCLSNIAGAAAMGMFSEALSGKEWQPGIAINGDPEFVSLISSEVVHMLTLLGVDPEKLKPQEPEAPASPIILE